MSRSEGNRRAAGTPARGPLGGTMARKSIVAFSAMFIIPMLLAAYLFTRRTGPLGGDSGQLALLSMCVLVLGLGGFFLIRSVIHSMLSAARDASAIVEGDLDRRLDTEVEGEISELARNFNRITSRLQKTIDSLETSKGQIQTLLSQVCLTFGQNIDMAHMLEVFLKSLLSLTGLEMGAIFLLSSDEKELSVHASVGLREEERSTAILRGRRKLRA